MSSSYVPRAEMARQGWSRPLIDFLARNQNIAPLQSEIDAANATIAALQATVTTLEGTVTALEGQIANEAPQSLWMAPQMIPEDPVQAIATPTGPAILSDGVSAGDFTNVYNSSGTSRVRKADATDPAKFCNSFVLADIPANTTGPVQFSGLNPLAIASALNEVWLSETVPGSYQTAAPTGSGHIVQGLGPAMPGFGVAFIPGPRIEL